MKSFGEFVKQREAVDPGLAAMVGGAAGMAVPWLVGKARQGFEHLRKSKEERALDVLASFLKERDPRLYNQLVSLVIQEPARPAIDNAEIMRRNIDALNFVTRKYPSSNKLQEKKWMEMTGRSRATFYRLKKAMLAGQTSESPEPPVSN